MPSVPPSISFLLRPLAIELEATSSVESFVDIPSSSTRLGTRSFGWSYLCDEASDDSMCSWPQWNCHNRCFTDFHRMEDIVMTLIYSCLLKCDLIHFMGPNRHQNYSFSIYEIIQRYLLRTAKVSTLIKMLHWKNQKLSLFLNNLSYLLLLYSNLKEKIWFKLKDWSHITNKRSTNINFLFALECVVNWSSYVCHLGFDAAKFFEAIVSISYFKALNQHALRDIAIWCFVTLEHFMVIPSIAWFVRWAFIFRVPINFSWTCLCSGGAMLMSNSALWCLMLVVLRATLIGICIYWAIHYR